jgi:hypothetical protein
MRALASILAFGTLIGFGGLAHAQPMPPKITIGIFAPTVEFGTAQARLAYVQGLAKAVEQSTGIKTEAQAFASAGAMKDKVDFAIIDGQCYAQSMSGKLVASATINGATTRAWALYSSEGASMQALKGKKLAFVATGCNDAGFTDNAMLDGEVDPGFFASRVGSPDLTAAVAAVASYKSAQAVFAPVGSAKNLTKVFETGAAPNPAFVELAGKLPQNVVDKVAAAVIGFGGGGAIGGWTKPSREIYASLSGRFGKPVKLGMMANPEPVRIDAKDVLIDPPTLRDSAVVDIRHHFVRPPGARME